MRPKLFTVDRPGPGRLSTMARPRGGDWLEDEMAALRNLGVDVLVSALPPSEQAELGLLGEAAAARRAGLEFVTIPIRDRGVPEVATTLPMLRELARRLHLGAQVAVHCRVGIGRASMLAAAILVLDGTDPDQAWRQIGRARGLPVPDTEEQRRWAGDLPPAAGTGSSAAARRRDSSPDLPGF